MSIVQLIFISFTLFMAVGTASALTLTVDSTANTDDANLLDGVCATSGGFCTLRAAIQQANSIFSPGAHNIHFNIPGAGVHEIDLANNALPPIRFAGSIDGTTQPGSSCASESEMADLKISLRGDGYIADLTPRDWDNDAGIRVDHADVTIKGLGIIYFPYGIYVETLAFSAMRQDNITIQCNHIGVSSDGEESDFYANSYGIFFPSAPITGCLIPAAPESWSSEADGIIGGNTPELRNLISGTEAGIYVGYMGNWPSDWAILCGVNARNKYSGHLKIKGNYIGTDGNGNPGAIIGDFGIYIDWGNNPVTVGGNEAAGGNLISNNGTGVFIEYHHNADIYNNQIGKTPLGVTPQGNHYAGLFIKDSSHVQVGKSDGTDGNEILGNLEQGIAVTSSIIHDPLDPRSTYTTIRGNRIHHNEGIGIDLGDDGVTANDSGDSDLGGPNELQNFPALTKAGSTGIIAGFIDTLANEPIVLDFFSSSSCDNTFFGEGETFLGTSQVITNATGAAVINENFGVIAPGKYVTATATNSYGNTSEFSPCAPVAEVVFEVNVSDLGDDANPGDGNCETTIGNCSLRAAIQEANTLGGGPHKILFTQSVTIIPSAAEALPEITTPIILDATGDGGSVCASEVSIASYGVILDGSLLTSGSGLVLAAGSNGSQISGLLIADFPGHGLSVKSSGNRVFCNHIGSQFNPPFSRDGNDLDGIHITGSDNIIGGATAALRNLLSGNGQSGIEIEGLGTTGNIVQGNAVGLNASLIGASANGEHGVELDDLAHDNIIGGNSLPERNVVSGNTEYGIRIRRGSYSNKIRGNYVGTTADGLTSIPNLLGGISLNDSPDNTIGGSAENYGNLISGNSGHGIKTEGMSDGTVIKYNRIGLDKAGNPLANDNSGVHLHNNSNSVVLNDISFNLGDGVQIVGDTNHNKIRQNSMVGNGGLGIDLGNDGVTGNDVDDADTGANNLLNFPELGYAQPDTALTGMLLDVTNGMDYYLDFYSSAACDASGHGEGDTHLGSHTFTATSTGQETITTSITGLAAEDFITATVTLGSGQSSTSEFSACIPAIPDHLKLQNITIEPGNPRHRACSYITAEQDSRVTAGTNAVFKAGTAMQFRNGFAVKVGASLTLEFIKPNACP